MELPSSRAICYLDILGFADLMQRLDDDEELFGRVRFFMDFFVSQDTRSGSNVQPDLLDRDQVTVFSSCAILSTSPHQLHWVVSQARYIAQYLLYMGALTRGAAVLGRLYHRDRLVFGSGLSNVRNIEQSRAIHPRIILPNDVVEVLLSRKEDHLAIDWNQALREDVDGEWYVDLFVEPFGPPTKTFRGAEKPNDWMKRIGLVLKTLAREECESSSPSSQQMSRITWIIDRFNRALEERFGGATEPVVV